MKKISLTKFILSTILVVGGILLLLVNLGLISLEINNLFVYIIPILLVLLGVKELFEGLFMKKDIGSSFFGLICTLYGLLLVGGILHYIDFGYWDIFKLWPLLLVYFGINIFTSSRKNSKRRKMKIEFNSDNDEEDNAYSNRDHDSAVFNIVGDANFTGPNWSVEPMDIHKKILDYEFDFSSTFIPDKETPIKITGWVGDIKIRVPEDIEFMVEGKANIGDVKIAKYSTDGLGHNLNFKTPGYDEAVRKIKFTFYFKIIDLRIDQV